jgi:Cdc6-like AAA superfamily ATPase
MVVLIAFGCSPAGAVAGGAAGPQFLEQDRLSIPLERLRTGSRWQITVANPGAAVDAEVRLTGGIADALAIEGGGRVRLGPGGAATVVMVPGKRPRAGNGQLVLISAAGIDRRQVSVTVTPFLERYRLALIAAALLVVAVAVLLWWRRPAHDKEEPPSARPAGESPGYTHSDEPAATDRLNRKVYAEYLAELARTETPPLVIGILGEWGTGKTSMLMQVRDIVATDPQCAQVWFDPWRHQYDDNPVLSLLHTIVTELGLEKRQHVRRTLRTISEVLGSLVLSASIKLNVADVRRSFVEYDAENFRIRSERTRLDEHLGRLIRLALATLNKSRLVVFVDDLDRCHADQITALLDALKLHFNRADCVFVLAVDKEPLLAAVREKYQDPRGDYLDKIVQLPFDMPRLSDEDFDQYLDDLLDDGLKDAIPSLRSGLRSNPRAIKRFVNVLTLQDRVARARGLDPYDVTVLAAVLLIRDGDSTFYARLAEDPTLLKRIAEDIETAGEDELPAWSPLPLKIVEAIRESVPEDVRPYIDLVKASPVPTPGDLTLPLAESASAAVPDAAPGLGRPSRRALGTARDVLAEGVLARADRVSGDEGELLPPVIRFAEDEVARPAELDEILARGAGRLMIIGPPGAGKTVLAARLARRMLTAHTRGQIPVLLSFRAIEGDFVTVERSLTHALVDEYQISMPDAFAMVDRGLLTLVLDGLDELDAAAGRTTLVQSVVRWAGTTGAGIIMTDRSRPAREFPAARLGFHLLELLGVPEEDARHRLEALLISRQAVPRRLLSLSPELLGSPQMLSTLTTRTGWIDDLPEHPVEFLPWYAARAVGRSTAEDTAAVASALGEVARLLAAESRDTFSSDDAKVRAMFRGSGIRGVQVPSVLHAMVDAGLLRESAPETYHFVHPLLRDLIAGW